MKLAKLALLSTILAGFATAAYYAYTLWSKESAAKNATQPPRTTPLAPAAATASGIAAATVKNP